MTRLIHGELIRLFATRLPLLAAGVAVLAGATITGLLSLVGPENATPPMPGLDTAEGVGIVVGINGLLLFVPALIGAIAVTGSTGTARSARHSSSHRGAARCCRRSSWSTACSASPTAC